VPAKVKKVPATTGIGVLHPPIFFWSFYPSYISFFIILVSCSLFFVACGAGITNWRAASHNLESVLVRLHGNCLAFGEYQAPRESNALTGIRHGHI
jgi:hypothetical protein